MSGRDIIAIGASAGGVETLAELARGLPPGFPASLFVVCHIPAGSQSILPKILSRSGPLLATHAVDGEPFHPGHVYVAPPDHHLLLAPEGRLRLNRGPRENHHRPAIDPLFRSAARHYDSRVIGVILTGGLSDGAAGLMAVRAAGGVAVVQDPRDAAVAAMPRSATEIAGADHIVPAAELAPLLINLVRGTEPPSPGGPNRRAQPMASREQQPVDPIERMPDTVDEDMAEQARNGRRGEVSVFTCPECGGSLWQVDDAGLVRFRCHVGHAYNGEALIAEQSEALEAALWTAVRTFREKSVLGRQLASAERGKGNAKSAARFEDQAVLAEQYANLILKHVLNAEPQDTLPREPGP
jgi:two-component system chemotaxis response regulator CheB